MHVQLALPHVFWEGCLLCMWTVWSWLWFWLLPCLPLCSQFFYIASSTQIPHWPNSQHVLRHNHDCFSCSIPVSVRLTLWVFDGSSDVFWHWRRSSALSERCVARKAARVLGVCCSNGFQGQWRLNVCFMAAAVSCAPCASRQLWALWSRAQSETMHFISSGI